MQTRPPLSNLKTRAQAAFRFLYLSDFDLADDDNESSARDCSVVCLCNLKLDPHPYPDPTDYNVWGPCECDHCREAAAMDLPPALLLCLGADQ